MAQMLFGSPVLIWSIVALWCPTAYAHDACAPSTSRCSNVVQWKGDIPELVLNAEKGDRHTDADGFCQYGFTGKGTELFTDVYGIVHVGEKCVGSCDGGDYEFECECASQEIAVEGNKGTMVLISAYICFGIGGFFCLGACACACLGKSATPAITATDAEAGAEGLQPGAEAGKSAEEYDDEPLYCMGFSTCLILLVGFILLAIALGQDQNRFYIGCSERGAASSTQMHIVIMFGIGVAQILLNGVFQGPFGARI